LKKVGDGSIWYAYKAKEHDKFPKDILDIVERIDASFKKNGFTTYQGTNVVPVIEQSLYCTNCGSKESPNHNYCGKCGNRLAKSPA
jgi:hypothetical protein